MRFILSFGWPYLRKYRTRFVIGIVLGMLCGASNALFPWAVKNLAARISPPAETVTRETTVPLGGKTSALREELRKFEAKVEGALDPWMPRAGEKPDLKRSIGLLAFLPFLVFIRGFLSYVSGYCMKWVSERIITDMRYDVLAKMQTLSLDFFNKSKTGDLMMRLSADTKAIYQCLNFGFSDLVKEPVAVLGLLAALWIMDWQLTAFSMIFFPLCIVPIIVLGRKTRKAGKGSMKAEISQSSLLVEGVANIRVVKAFGLEEQQQKRFRKLADERIRHNMRANRAEELLNPLIELSAAVGMGALLLFIFYSGRSIPDLLGFATALGLLYTPVKKIAKIHLTFQKALFGVERIRETFAQQPAVREPAAPAPFPAFRRGIDFENVTFSYGEGPVLDHVSFSVRRGQRIGIAGPSGSGKSTIVNLLFRFYDVETGAVRIDGVDIREFSFADLRNHMGLVSQEILLFDATVAQNIACGRQGATREEIELAARMAGAESFIRALPQGYDTQVGERGTRLSGGQKQRLAIARALVRRAPILIMDEATAALDSASEAEVQKSIDQLSAEHTVITVAHRLGTLRNCDRILVMDAGRIVEQGTFEQLLAERGLFAGMAAKQGITTPGVLAPV